MESHAVSFRVEKEDLANAVSWVARNLPTKAAQPVLRAMIISADENGLELAGFDYEVSTRVRLNAEVAEFGKVAVAGKLISDICGSLPNRPVEFHTEGATAHLKCGSSRFDLPLIPLDDYPTIPTLPEVTGRVDPKLFTEAISQVAVAAGKDETLPMLTGVHMAITGTSVMVAATDRFRLARRTFQWNPENDGVSAKLLIPAKTLLDNARSLDTQAGDPIEIAVGSGSQVGQDGLFGIHSVYRETTTRMLDATYPNIDTLFPKEHTSLAVVEVEPLKEAIRRVSLVGERNPQLKLSFEPDQVTLSSSSSDFGSAEEAVPCTFHGPEGFAIGFNSQYVREGLGVIHSDRAVFGFTKPSQSAIMVPEPESLPDPDENGVYPHVESDFTYLLMPVRLPG